MSSRSMFAAAVLAVVALQALQRPWGHFSFWMSIVAAVLGTAAAWLLCYFDALLKGTAGR